MSEPDCVSSSIVNWHPDITDMSALSVMRVDPECDAKGEGCKIWLGMEMNNTVHYPYQLHSIIVL